MDGCHPPRLLEGNKGLSVRPPFGNDPDAFERGGRGAVRPVRLSGQPGPVGVQVLSLRPPRSGFRDNQMQVEVRKPPRSPGLRCLGN